MDSRCASAAAIRALLRSGNSSITRPGDMALAAPSAVRSPDVGDLEAYIYRRLQGALETISPDERSDVYVVSTHFATLESVLWRWPESNPRKFPLRR
jgi:hypothetical protein